MGILDFGKVGKNANNNNSSNYAKLNDSAYESISDMQESDDVKPVFSDKLFHYDQSSSDEGFEGSPAILRTPTKSTKLTSKWRSPSKSQHSTQPYLIEASPIRIQRTSRNKKYEAEQKLEKEQTDDKEEEVKVDFIAELAKRNMSHLVGQIFGHCGKRELQMSSEANSQWRHHIITTPRLDTRRRAYLTEKRARRRNPNFNRQKVSPNWRHTSKLRSAQNHQNRVIDQTSPLTRSRLAEDHVFVKPRIQHLKVVKRNLGLGEEMIYCPQCEYPATKTTEKNKGKCTMTKCNAVFCCKCKSNWHGSRPCETNKKNLKKKLAKL